MDRRAFDDCSPLELSWRLWGVRRRWNREALRVAWAVAHVIQPHVAQRDQSKVSPRVLYMHLAGGDLDEDEMA